MEDQYNDMSREELLNELRGLMMRYEKYRRITLPALNKITEERDQLQRTIARLESRLDQIAVDFEAIAELDPADFDGLALDTFMSVVRDMAIAAYERALGRDYFTDDKL